MLDLKRECLSSSSSLFDDCHGNPDNSLQVARGRELSYLPDVLRPFDLGEDDLTIFLDVPNNLRGSRRLYSRVNFFDALIPSMNKL